MKRKYWNDLKRKSNLKLEKQFCECRNFIIVRKKQSKVAYVPVAA